MTPQEQSPTGSLGNARSDPVGEIALDELLAAVTGPHERAAFALDATRIGDTDVAVEEVVVIEKPFCTLRHFRRRIERPDPRVLIVAPLSGHYATLLRDTVAGLLPDHEVYITDWIDARQVPLTAGQFDLDDNIDYVIEFLRRLGPELHVLAVCQSAVPTLAAIALLAAADDSAQPHSMILMGGLIDTARNPTRIARMARTISFPWIESRLIAPVPAHLPGALRPVYPASLQRAGLLLYLARHLEYLPGPHSRVRVFGDPNLADPQFCQELLTVMDLPAELFLQTIRTVFQERALPRRVMTSRGRAVEPEGIRRTALLTVEGALDDVSGRGQTRAAHDLCTGLAADRRAQHEQAGVGHFGMFRGRAWRAEILPKVREFIRAQGRRTEQPVRERDR